MKKLLILGAGIYQVPLIKKAKEMGLYTIVASIPGKYPGFQYADAVEYIDTTDLNKVLDLCQKERIDGVVVCGTDVCVPTQGYICEKMGLKGPSYQAAKIAQDKALMKKVFIENGVRTAEARYVDILNESPASICEEIGYPVIFKSIDSSGSRGITKVENSDQIEYAFEQVRSNTKSNTYIIEKYLYGEEFGAQAFIYDGELKFILPHGDYVFQGDTGVPIGHFAPFDVPEAVILDAKTQLVKAIKALNLDNCAINADFILHDGKTYVLELGARAGATCLVEMTSIYYGYNYYEKIIEAALGINPDFKGKKMKQPNAEMLFISDKTGIVERIELPEETDSRILDLSFDYKAGDEVRKFKKGPDRIGQIIAKGDTPKEAKLVIDRFMGKVNIVIR